MRKLIDLIIFLAGIGAGYEISQHRKPASERDISELGFTRKALRSAQFSWSRFFGENQNAIAIITLTSCALVFGSVLQNYGYIFKASLLDLPQTEFTGTTIPITHVPNWTELSEAERTMRFDQIPKSKIIPIPDYNLRNMKKGEVWEDATDAQRNAYITYPVPNLGNYKLDATENSGSHPGIDIKTLIGTPVHSIANGIVYKVGNQSTGFGKSVSVAHVNIPDPRNPGQTTTLVSTYAHMSKTNVREGEKVSKGQIIGESGDTGFATAPHLHFQIDRSDADFIPYWPFTYAELQAAGYNSNFDAVKGGFGRQKAKQYTEHPFNFIARFSNNDIDLNNLVALDDTIIPGVIENVDTPLGIETPDVEIIDTPENNKIEKWESTEGPSEEEMQASAPNSDPTQVELAEKPPVNQPMTQTIRKGKLEISFETDQSYTPGQNETITIRINEANLVATAGIEMSSTLRDRAKVTPAVLKASDFDANGEAEVIIKTSSEYPFRLVAVSDFGEIKSPSLKPEIFKDIPGSHPYSSAVKYLKDNNIVKGYEDGTFRPDATLNRAEALKLILEANSIYAESTDQNNFNDVGNTAWFKPYIETAFKREIVKGYPDGSFKPGNTVSRAEFLKMALATGNFPLPEFGSDPFPDVKADAWYAPFFAFARDQKLIRTSTGNTAVPNNPITRGEAADIIYKLSQIVTR
ncbi:peptidoglycan DD-metalloendopeptidase family protein [bacterium]|nr:peptidoglycan DD-metalloendopeptidase family protein [bacterium]NCQ55917.1 peptidoglycan DD-metalloendopeptidase family protein [Candidatus Parcubacteria bacterium]NCS96836.1 peptidoglycan DD-metalloendopeptidase family protein [bacterium]